ARQRHLLAKYLESNKEAPSVEKIVEDVVAALENFRKKYESETDVDKKKMYETSSSTGNSLIYIEVCFPPTFVANRSLASLPVGTPTDENQSHRQQSNAAAIGRNQ
ncbi:hypothetical protein OSTOST_24828, partial [Ostertagia ostertagi]